MLLFNQLRISLWVGIGLMTHFSLPAQHTWVIAPGTSVATSGTVHLVMDDVNWYQDGSFDAGQSIIDWQGTLPVSLGGTATLRFQDWNVDKGTTLLQLQADLSLNGSLTFTNGLVDLNGQTLSLGQAGQLLQETEQSRLTDLLGGGWITTEAFLNAPTQVEPGNLGVLISSASNLGLTEIRRGHFPQFINGSSSIERHVEIIPDNNINLAATVRIEYFDNELNGVPETNFKLWQLDNQGISWTPFSTTQHDFTNNWVQGNPFDTLGRFGINAGSPLPVTWLDIQAQWLPNGQAAVHWQVMQTPETESYQILRQDEQGRWEPLAWVPARASVGQEEAYVFVDRLQRESASGTYQYQVKQIDLDGTHSFSKVVSLHKQQVDQAWLQATPNPASKDLYIEAYVPGNQSEGTLLLINPQGKVVYRTTLSGSPFLQTQLAVTTYPPGLYVLVVQTQTNQFSQAIQFVHD